MDTISKNSKDKENEIHLLDYWNIIRLRLHTFIIIFVLVNVFALLFILIKTPVYRAKTKLLIKPISVNVADVKGMYDTNSLAKDFQGRQEFLATQIELMTSEGLLSKVFTDLHFDQTKEFRTKKDPLKAFKKLFDISLMRKTFLVTVAFDWKEPELAAKASRYLTKLYVEDYEKRSLGFSDQGLSNMNLQLLALKKEREKALAELVAYKRKYKMIDLDDAKELLVTRMVKMNEALIKAEVEEIKTGAAFKSVSMSSSIEESAKKYPEIFDNPTITKFKLEELKNQIEELGLLKEYNEKHKKVINQKRIIEYIKNAVNDEVAIALASVEVRYQRAKLLKELLAKGLNGLKEESFRLDEQASGYKILKDNYDAKDKAYKHVLNRINEITITKGSGKMDASGKIHIITLAKVPTEIYSPKKVRVMAIAFILALLLAGGTCFALDYIDRSVKYKEELEDIIKAPVLGMVPKLPKDNKETMALIQPLGNAFVEAFGSIRTSLGLSILGRSMKLFLVTSVVPQEGKTLLAFNMALSFARSGKRVLLMECDMRKPRLKKLLAEHLSNIPADGISSVIVGEAEFSNIVVPMPNINNLDIAFCGHIPPNPSELLGSQNFKDMLDSLQNHYDMIILDTPPILHVSDSVILAGTSIPVVFVTRIFKTEKKQLEIGVEQIKNAQGTIVGTVINNIETTASKTGYYYGGYYHEALEQED